MHKGHAQRAALIAGAAWLVGCEGVLGIEDAELDPLVTAATSDGCETYCDTVQSSCTTTRSVFTNRNTCQAYCERLPQGEAGDQIGNSVACRQSQAELAAATGEPDVHCPLAGPGGQGTCGTNCESYCQVFAEVCTTRFEQRYEGLADCVNFCDGGLLDLGSYDASMDRGDSIQCRLWHLSAAAVDPSFHCRHADGEDPCIDGA
ncbi:MAG: hypothetical protein JRI23_02330 [Deltaproteobacteria bacterium]|jgi:hypothetical protein|nr:hypothetical protein [Deltaproteobacteria bacterium]MBW2530318.1 hypothetical protein [Deltaproteobacteria bacterium]